MTKLAAIPELDAYRATLVAGHNGDKPCVTICGGTGCRAGGGLDVAEAFRSVIKARGLQDSVGIRVTGCHGFCEMGPLVVLLPAGIETSDTWCCQSCPIPKREPG